MANEFLLAITHNTVKTSNMNVSFQNIVKGDYFLWNSLQTNSKVEGNAF